MTKGKLWNSVGGSLRRHLRYRDFGRGVLVVVVREFAFVDVQFIVNSFTFWFFVDAVKEE